MVISEKYEILDMIEDGRVQTFRARHRTLGHSLMVHFVKGGNEENFELLEQLARLPEMKRQLFTDAGAQGTVPYLVSWPLPDFDNLNAWLHRCMPSPNAGPMTPKDLPKNRGAGTGPDEFTRIFFAGMKNDPAPAAAKDSGEFSRWFADSAAPANAEKKSSIGSAKNLSAQPGSETFASAPPAQKSSVPPASTEQEANRLEFNDYFLESSEPNAAHANLSRDRNTGPTAAGKRASDLTEFFRVSDQAAAVSPPGPRVSEPAASPPRDFAGPSAAIPPSGNVSPYSIVVRRKPGASPSVPKTPAPPSPAPVPSPPSKTVVPSSVSATRQLDERWYWVALSVLAVCAIGLILFFSLK